MEKKREKEGEGKIEDRREERGKLEDKEGEGGRGRYGGEKREVGKDEG